MSKRCSKCVFFCIRTRKLSLDFFSLFPFFVFPSDFIMHYLYLIVSFLFLAEYCRARVMLIVSWGLVDTRIMFCRCTKIILDMGKAQ
jgi:hypothetical protein